MKTSLRGQKFIKDHEGLRLTTYLDAKGVPTIGYGHTSDAYFPVKLKQRITKAKAEDLFRHDMEEAEAALDRVVKVPLNGNQFGALISLIFNIGITAFKRSTLLRVLNRGDYAGASRQFGVWIRSGKKKLDGLRRRRAEEQALFNTPEALGDKTIDYGPIKGATPETEEARNAKGNVASDKPSFWSKLIPVSLFGGGISAADGLDLWDRLSYSLYGVPVWVLVGLAGAIGLAVLVYQHKKND